MVFCLLLFQICSLSFVRDSEECDFNCWIEHLNISINNISTTVDILGLSYDLSIYNFLIYGISLDELKATFYPNPDKIEDGIKIMATFGASFQGNIHLDRTAVHQGANFSGTATGVNFSIVLNFVKNSDGFIETVVAPSDQCSASIDDLTASIHADSTFWDLIINVLEPIIVSLLKSEIQPLLCDTLPNIIGDEFTIMFSSVNQVIYNYLNDTSPIHIDIGEGMSDLRKSILIDFARFLLTNFTGIDGPLSVNTIINKISNNTGILSLSEVMNYFSVTTPISFSGFVETLNATFNMTLIDLNVSGLNTWKDFTFIEPISEYILDTHTSMDTLGVNLTFEINVSADGSVVTTGDVYLTEQADLYIMLDNNSMDFQMQLAAPSMMGMNYTDPMCLDVGCLLSLASPDGTGMTLIDFNTSLQYLALEAGKQDMELEIRTFINNVIKLFISSYRNVIPPFLNGFLNQYGVYYVNSLVNQTLNEAECNYSPNYPYSDITIWTTVLAFSLVIVFTLLIYILMKIAESLRKKYSLIPSIHMITYDRVDSIEEDQNFVKYHYFINFFRTDQDASLLMTPKLSIFVRYLIPFLIFGNIAVFVSSNTGIGASVFIKFFVGSQKKISMDSMFDFTLINSVIDMWKAGAYPLSILIFLMSCLWPYTKLAMMIIAWICPGSIIKPSRRESLFRFLDAVGKWSLMDSYVMIIMVVAFHFEIAFPIMSDKVEEPFTVDLFVYPAYAIFTLILGTLYSLLLSHIMLALERYVDNAIVDDINIREFKSLFRFTRNKILKIAIPVIIIITICIVGAGVYLKTFSFQFVGLTGWALQLLGIENTNSYSVIDLALALPPSAEYPNSFVVRFIQVIYTTITFIMPLLQLFSLLFLWIIPMTRKAQITFYKTCETIYAWSCLDVFVLAIIASIIQISALARFMIGDKCDAINPIVKDFFSDEPFIKGHESCFDVKTLILSGSWMLFAAAIVQNIVTVIVTRVARRALEERTMTDSASNSALKSTPLLTTHNSSSSGE